MRWNGRRSAPRGVLGEISARRRQGGGKGRETEGDKGERERSRLTEGDKGGREGKSLTEGDRGEREGRRLTEGDKGER